MFKVIKKIFKLSVTLIALVFIIIVCVFVFNFLINGVTGQAKKKCQEITSQDNGGKEVVYASLANWLTTQSTSLVTVDEATYNNDPKKGDQIIIKYTLYGNIYSGEKTITNVTLEKFCGK